MNFSEKIYKKDSKGKIRVLHVYNNGSNLIQESGLLDGKLVKHESECTSKNIGRSNETTPEEQAQLEAASKIETKLTTGYFKTIEEVNNNVVILPMLAKDYKKESHKVVFPCYIQPKLDGMRMLGKKDAALISRKGKEITTLGHIQKELDSLHCIDVLDGEAYAHGKTFQENMKLIKKYRPDETEDVKYHVYDMVYPNMSFIERYTLLKTLIKAGDFSYIELVPTFEINNEEELKEWHIQAVAEGYEGTIIRHSNAGYGINKRDSQLLKYKDFIDLAVTIKDVIPGEKNPTHGYFIFDWPGAKGHPLGDDILGCGMKYSHSEREYMLNHKEEYIGKKAELRFFEYSDDGVPRFPVAIGTRLDK